MNKLQEKLESALGFFGTILFNLLRIAISALPFVMIDVDFFVMLLSVFLNTSLPHLSAIFWIWGLVCAIQGPQDILTILYYVIFVVAWIPFYLSLFGGLLNQTPLWWKIRTLVEFVTCGGNYRHIAHHTGAIYYIINYSFDGRKLSPEQKAYAMAIWDAVPSLMTHDFSEDELLNSLKSAKKGILVLGNHTMPFMFDSKLKLNDDFKLAIALTMQTLCLILRSSTRHSEQDILSSVAKKSNVIAKTFIKTYKKGPTRKTSFLQRWAEKDHFIENEEFRDIIIKSVQMNNNWYTEVENTIGNPEQHEHNTYSISSKKASANWSKLVLSVVLIVSLIVIIVTNADISSKPKTTKNIYTDETGEAESESIYTLPEDFVSLTMPVQEPKSGTILSGNKCTNAAQITVSASYRSSCVVKLKNESDETKLSFYVQAGDTITVNVPRECLYVYFAEGTTWYGEELLFGSDTYYSKDEDICDFVMYTYTYTLYSVNNGNFEQTPIDADEFK